jgi:hypothetical protein
MCNIARFRLWERLAHFLLYSKPMVRMQVTRVICAAGRNVRQRQREPQ